MCTVLMSVGRGGGGGVAVFVVVFGVRSLGGGLLVYKLQYFFIPPLPPPTWPVESYLYPPSPHLPGLLSHTSDLNIGMVVVLWPPS